MTSGGRPGPPLWAAAAFCVSGAAATLHLGQDANWDLANYHLYNAWALLQGGRFTIDAHPAGEPSFFNPLLDVLSYPLLMGVPDRWGGALLGAVHGFAAFLLFLLALEALGTHRRGMFLALLAVLAGATSAMAWSQLGTTFGDLTTAVLVLAALLIVARFSGRAIVLLGLAGTLIGIAVGLKLPNGIYAIGLAAAVALLPAPQRARAFAVFLGGAALGFLMAYGWWGWTLHSHFGSPIFPFANSRFQAPLYPPQDLGYLRFFPRDGLEWVFYPFYFATNHRTAEVPFRDFRLAAAYLAVAALAGAWLLRRLGAGRGDAACPSTNPAARRILAFVVGAYVAWLIVFSTQRYATVLELLAPLMVILALAVLAPARMQAALAAAMSAALVAATVPPDWKRLPWDGNRHSEAWNLDPALRGAAAILGSRPLAFLAPTTGFGETAWIGSSFNEADRVRNEGLIGSRPAFLLAFPWRDFRAEAQRVMRELGFGIAAPCAKFTTKLMSDVLMCPLGRGASFDAALAVNHPERWSFEARPAAAEVRLRRGAPAWLELELRNDGPDTLWANVPDTMRLAGLSTRDDGVGEINLSYHLLSEQGATLVHDGVRTAMPLSIAPGGMLRVSMRVVAPEAAGRYRLQPDLVMEGVRWAGAAFRVSPVLLTVE